MSLVLREVGRESGFPDFQKCRCINTGNSETGETGIKQTTLNSELGFTAELIRNLRNRQRR